MYRQAQPREASAPPVPICGHCGVIAPAQARACPVCARDYPVPRALAPAEDDLCWLALRCSFQCRSCHFLSPLDELDIDGSVECAHCLVAQRFDVGAWQEALEFAHAVGDLAFPPPEGRHPNPWVWIGSDNPHLRIGYTEVFGEHRQSSTTFQHGITVHRSLFIQASPGYPVCTKCGVVLRVAQKGERTNARCDSCGEQASYRLPSQANQYAAGLAGVVALDHRMDKPLALLETHGGTNTLKCGQCGGDLPAKRDRVVECGYCHATNLVPARARTREQGAALTPAIWWLAFRGPSATRRLVESPATPITGLSQRSDSTPLEQAQRKKTLNLKQLLLALVLPAIALVAGYLVMMLFALHRLSF